MKHRVQCQITHFAGSGLRLDVHGAEMLRMPFLLATWSQPRQPLSVVVRDAIGIRPSGLWITNPQSSSV